MLDRRKFLKFGSLSAGTLSMMACSSHTPELEEKNQDQTDPVNAGPSSADGSGAGLSQTQNYTRENPGPWEDKIDGHLPNVVVENGGLFISTNHEMADDHYISRHQVIDETGRVLYDNVLAPGAEAVAETRVITVLPSGENFKVLSTCNKHGIWEASFAVSDFTEAFAEFEYLTEENPGHFPGKIAGHVPSVSSANPGFLEVTTDHGMAPEHYIMRHQVVDDRGMVLGDYFFDIANETVAKSKIPALRPETDVFHVYSSCNLHGWWRKSYNTADYLNAFTNDPLYTEENPGRWAEKIAGHVPAISVSATGALEVKTEHGMEAEHYISLHRVEDMAGNLLAENNLDPAIHTTAVSVFDIPLEKTGSINVYSACNLHGLWQKTFSLEEISGVYTLANPGPEAGREAAHIPTIAYVPDSDEIQVSTPHEMNENNADLGSAHYISVHEVQNQNGKVIGKTRLRLGVDLAAISYYPRADFVGSTFHIFSTCNLHGIWRNTYSFDSVFGVYTRLAPRDQAGREEGHLPKVEIVEKFIQVTTNHEMVAEHYISKHEVRNANGDKVAENNFVPGTDTLAVSKFLRNSRLLGVLSFYSTCNQHGIWREDFEIKPQVPAASDDAADPGTAT